MKRHGPILSHRISLLALALSTFSFAACSNDDPTGSRGAAPPKSADGSTPDATGGGPGTDEGGTGDDDDGAAGARGDDDGAAGARGDDDDNRPGGGGGGDDDDDNGGGNANNDDRDCDQAEDLNLEDLAEFIREDLDELNDDEKPFTRYFTFAHLAKDPQLCDELDNFVLAAGKAINSTINLSEIPNNGGLSKVTGPEPLDVNEDKTLSTFRIDIRDYGWDVDGDFDDKWERIIQALINDNFPVFRLGGDDGDAIAADTGTNVPLILGDHLTNRILLPPLYNDLTELPGNLADLETALDVNIGAELVALADNGGNDKDIVLAGTLTLNGESDADRDDNDNDESDDGDEGRIVQRTELTANDNVFDSEFLWTAFDFNDANFQAITNKDDPDGDDLFDIFEEQEDVFDNSDSQELIFQLPNGMFGFMVVDGAGNRDDIGGDDFYFDGRNGREDFDSDTAFAGGNASNVFNGFSCLSCHFSGIEEVDDEVFDEFDDGEGDELNLDNDFADAYEPEQFEDARKADSDDFIEAVGSIARDSEVEDADGVDQNKDNNSVFFTFDQFLNTEDNDLDAERVAVELFLDKDKIQDAIDDLDDFANDNAAFGDIGAVVAFLELVDDGDATRDNMLANYAALLCLFQDDGQDVTNLNVTIIANGQADCGAVDLGSS